MRLGPSMDEVEKKLAALNERLDKMVELLVRAVDTLDNIDANVEQLANRSDDRSNPPTQ